MSQRLPTRTPPIEAEAEFAVAPGQLKISSRQILLLNALDQYRNMRRAAMAMNTTQPTVSLLLQKLEERLNVKLFERQARGVQPTVCGEVMIRYAKNASYDFNHAEAEIAELSAGSSGVVRVGSVTGPVPSLLTQRLLVFKAERPGVRISVDVGTSDTLLASLIHGDLDLVLGRLPDQTDNQNLEIHFFERGEQMSVVARPGHPLAGKPGITLSDLFAQTWILHPAGSPMRSRVETALKRTRLTAKLDIVETSSLLATTSMIEASDMISVVSREVALHYAKYGMVTILPVKLPLAMVNLGILTRKAKHLSPAVLNFLDCLKRGMQ